ncbi:hypothetical protein OSB04_009141 [Centaurea solstitialis]|uniref:Uncharacterized protein n=1 Tax=Centaurea solstitialis TaxID=347529 RepID=A0AA38TYN0_9ASTR|nr:hypothetical protein OSB04_009141 [Centaurea solstitialis]
MDAAQIDLERLMIFEHARMNAEAEYLKNPNDADGIRGFAPTNPGKVQTAKACCPELIPSGHNLEASGFEPGVEGLTSHFPHKP